MRRAVCAYPTSTREKSDAADEPSTERNSSAGEEAFQRAGLFPPEPAGDEEKAAARRIRNFW